MFTLPGRQDLFELKLPDNFIAPELNEKYSKIISKNKSYLYRPIDFLNETIQSVQILGFNEGTVQQQQPRVTQQWKKNVYTSQPNSKKYDMIRKNIDNTPKKDDDFWKLFDLNDAENELTRPQQGPIDNGYDTNDVDFDENDYINNNRR
jgi:hypothetical protein